MHTSNAPDITAETTEAHRSRSPLALRISYLRQLQQGTHVLLDSLFRANDSWRARALTLIPAALVKLDSGGYAGLLRDWVRFDAVVEGSRRLPDVARRCGMLRGVTGHYVQRVAESPWTLLEVKEVIGLDGITAEDVLTGERHFVANQDAARSAEPRRIVLARPVRMEGTSTLEGRSDVSLPRSARDRLRGEVARRMRLPHDPGRMVPLRNAGPSVVRDAMVAVARTSSARLT